MTALIFREEDMWVAQCIEHDIAAQGKTIPRLLEALKITIMMEAMIGPMPPPPPAYALVAAGFHVRLTSSMWQLHKRTLRSVLLALSATVDKTKQ